MKPFLRRHANRARVATLVVAALLGTAAVATASTPDVPETVDIEHMTDAEELVASTAGRNEFHARYRAWLDEFIASGSDPRDLPQSPIMAYYMPPLTDLPSAIGEATSVVVGTASSVSFHHGGGATVTFVVDRTLKGELGDSVTIEQGGGPMPNPDWESGTLAYAENAPLLLPGDRAILLLEPADGGAWWVQSFTGIYRIEGPVVRALDGNPFRGDVDGMPLETFVTRIQELAGS